MFLHVETTCFVSISTWELDPQPTIDDETNILKSEEKKFPVWGMFKWKPPRAYFILLPMGFVLCLPQGALLKKGGYSMLVGGGSWDLWWAGGGLGELGGINSVGVG
jgi:hypothetical protein